MSPRDRSIGELTEVVDLEDRLPGTDVWLPVFRNEWAALEAIGGRERLQASQVQPAPEWRVELWERPGVHTGMRVAWRSRYGRKVLQILAVVPAGARMVLECVEGKADA